MLPQIQSYGDFVYEVAPTNSTTNFEELRMPIIGTHLSLLAARIYVTRLHQIDPDCNLLVPDLSARAGYEEGQRSVPPKRCLTLESDHNLGGSCPSFGPPSGV